ncbi:flavin-containing monooxygenase [Ruicaihuangia caeni]|uniref:NAD(P)/FAD-dependent oxidoreductase n=1 Tax=Ruicaihuangia caeni TaxID=3042517 RepID=A0AAW6T9I4_9MICO|nr:NAD(P)/FAD-dependent oxidoreductase [Klugiella sp. YN-L-19]MDI2098693.1 NAD(P)/FAD-dependent oxidoreductase [Klugiella sp. YN-L-19]
MSLNRSDIREHLRHANTNVLRAVLYLLTGDRELAVMRTIECERRGGAFIEHVLGERDAQRVIELAADFLATPHSARRSDANAAPSADQERVRDAIGFLLGSRPSAAEFRLGIRELGLEEVSGVETSRAVWSRGQDVTGWRALVVGTGFSGIGMAVRLQELGIPYSVVDKQSRIGGTWERNQFPEARVDTTSFVYQYSFVEYAWKQHYAPQEQVREYLEHVAETYGVTPNIRLNTEVVEARFDRDTSLWNVLLRDAAGREWREEANFIVSASGLFSTPKWPDFPGMERFRGPVLHSAQWDPEFDPRGKRVGIVGNGSTGVQIMPWLARNAEHVYVFQRTPQWISPLEKYKEHVSTQTQWLHDNIPFYWRWSCYNARLIRGSLGDAQEYDRAWQALGGKVSRRNDGLRANLTEYIATKLGHDPDLQRACTPDYAPLARRLVVDNGWYDAVVQPNVTLVPRPVAALDETTVECSDGSEFECDALVLATGFDAEKYTLPAQYYSASGQTLEEAWAEDGPRAYVGLEVPGFPNLYVMYGPNGQPRGGSLVAALELWVDYIARHMVRTIESGHRSSAVRPEAFEAYNSLMDKEMERLIWEGEAPQERNYYVNRFGRQNVNMPWRIHDYAAILRRDPEETHELSN